MPRELEVPSEVLYIEDHPTNVHLMQAIFRHCAHLNLVVARSGQEARAMAAKVQPVLLLVDLRLPDCHGAELLQELRRTHQWQDVPAVAVTAESRFDLSGAGFRELWPKPLDLALVLERLNALTEGGEPRFFQAPFSQGAPTLRPI